MNSARCVGNPYLRENVYSQYLFPYQNKRFNSSSLLVGNALEHSAFSCLEYKKKSGSTKVYLTLKNIGMIFTTKL